MRRIHTSIALAVVLAGCTSLNVIQFGSGQVVVPEPRHPFEKPPNEVAGKKPVKVSALPASTVVIPAPEKGGVYLCPEYSFSDIKDTPELPLKEFNSRKVPTTAEVNRLLFNHIDVLRNHIAELKSEMVKSKRSYLNDCKLYHEKTK